MKTNKILTATLLMSTALAGVAQAQTIDYGMMESLFSEPVTASATGKPQRASDAPVSMEILGSEEIRRSGAKDIPQLLRRVAGVQVQRMYNGRAEVSIRGYNKPLANRLLVLVNGRQVLSDAFGNANWEGLSIGMDEIRQIEVIKGPNSSLFGFNAESGVINIITFSPLKDNIDSATVKVGTQDHKEVSLIHTAQFDNFGIRVSAGEKNMDGFSRSSMTDLGSATSAVDKGADNENAIRRVNVDAEWQLAENTNLRAQIGHNDNKVRGMTPFAAPSLGSNDFDFAHLTLAHQSNYGLWNSNLYKIANDSFGSTGSENDLTVLQVNNLFKVGTDHSFRIAGEYRDNQLSGGIIDPTNDDATFSLALLAPSVMWDWKVSDKWNWTNSVRYDHADYARNADTTFDPADKSVYNRTIEEFSFNSGLAYKPTATDTFRFSVSRGLHIPSLIELGGSATVATNPVSIGFNGNIGLEPERIMSYELAWDKKLPEHNMNFRSALFLQKAENLIDDTVSGSFFTPPISLTFDNKGDSTTWGAELGLDGIYNNWLRWGANYTYLQTEDDTDALLYEDAQAEHQVSLLAGFDHGNWEFDTDVHYISDYTSQLTSTGGIVSEDIDGYFVVNARAGYNVNDKLNIAIEGYNLVEEHREWVLAETPTSGGVSGANTLGRSVLATLTYKY